MLGKKLVHGVGPDIMLGTVMTASVANWWIFAPSGPKDEAPRRTDARPRESAVESGVDRTERGAAPLVRGVSQHDLLTQLRASDEGVAQAALETLYLALFERLWRFAYLTVRQRDIAEEVTQDVFFAVWQRRSTLKVEGDISVYLHTAVRYRAMKYLRHDRVVSRHAEDAVHADVSFPQIARLEGPEETLSFAELERMFLDALAAVPDRARQALTLRWRDGWTYDEVGEALGISKVGARALILRYQERLRPFLDRLRQELEG